MENIVEVNIDNYQYNIPKYIMDILLPSVKCLESFEITSNRYRWRIELEKYNNIQKRKISRELIDEYCKNDYMKQLNIILKYKLNCHSIPPKLLEYALSKDSFDFDIFDCVASFPKYMMKYVCKYRILNKRAKYPRIHEVLNVSMIIKDYI